MQYDFRDFFGFLLDFFLIFSYLRFFLEPIRMSSAAHPEVVQVRACTRPDAKT
jgi:hypothetical protein